MKIRELMTSTVVRIHPEESVAVAARTLARYNIGILPVCGSDGRLCGLVTDRDIVTRCLAAGRSPAMTAVRDVMTTQILSARPDMDAGTAAAMMGRNQIRRLPVMENGRLCGMVSLGDLAVRDQTSLDASDALGEISSSVSHREGFR
ncbi:MAG: CBS domain-containing protein [Oscillospiraceae bacterium]|nr:CBS domain-containing protein [Oscillospiraceae bacterium]